MAVFEGHATKRQRTDVVGRGVQSGARDRFDEPHKATPSRVVLVGGLGNVKDEDLVEAMQHFGLISYIKMAPRKGEALVEFEDLEGAKRCVEYTQSHPNNIINVGGKPAYFDYFNRPHIPRPGDVEMEDDTPANCVILITVLYPKYPIDTSVKRSLEGSKKTYYGLEKAQGFALVFHSHIIKKVTEKFGKVLRIVMIRKNGVQAMVEFESPEGASEAKHTLNGRDIYSGCCTLKIEYARPKTLTVHKNDSETFDYTNPDLTRRRGPALLDDPEPPLFNGPTVRPGPPPPGRFGGPPPPGPRGRGRGFPPAYDHGYEEQGGYHPRGPSMGGYAEFDQFGGPNHGQHGLQPTPHNMPNQMGNGSRVVMVYNMDPDNMNCDRLFNLLCLYGNVWKVKFMKSKQGCAMVEMNDAYSVGLAISNLSNITFMGRTIQLGFSNQMTLHGPKGPVHNKLPDGTDSFVDYTDSKNNRYLTEKASSKNRLQRPGNVLHFFNAHPDSTEDRIKKLFVEAGAKEPIAIKMFEPKNEKSRCVTGLVEWEDRSDAIEALVIANHVPMENPGGRFPYTFKLCFSNNEHAV